MVAIAMIVIMLLAISSMRERRLEKEAEADVRLAREYFQRAVSSVALADSLRAGNMALQTVSQENDALANAIGFLGHADSLKMRYIDAKASYAYLFSQISTESLRGEIQFRRDSMFRVWKQYALSNFEYYLDNPDTTNLIIATRYTKTALEIRPDDEDLLTINDILNQRK